MRDRNKPVEPSEKNLDGIALFEGFDKSELTQLAAACRWRRFTAHQQVIDKYSESRDIYFVVEGRVRIVNYSLGGKEITLDDLPKGCFFGEMLALDGLPRSARVVSNANSLIAAMDYRLLLKTVEKHPELALKLMVHLVKMVRDANLRIMDLTTLAANDRVHGELLRRAQALSDDGNQAEIKPIPVHGDIANRIGTARETVARVLNDLAR